VARPQQAEPVVPDELAVQRAESQQEQPVVRSSAPGLGAAEEAVFLLLAVRRPVQRTEPQRVSPVQQQPEVLPQLEELQVALAAPWAAAVAADVPPLPSAV
jgi:hypothetical protein